MSSLVVLQPAGNQGSRQHYADTVAKQVEIKFCEPYLAPQVFRKLLEIHPTGLAAMWGVVPGASEVNRRKWERMSEGNVVLFSSDKKSTLLQSLLRNLRRRSWLKNYGDWTLIRRLGSICTL